MKKKTYSRPELAVIELRLRDVICGSTEDFSYQINLGYVSESEDEEIIDW